MSVRFFTRVSTCIFAAMMAASLAACNRGRETADAVYFGGPIYTGLVSAPTVEAVAVKDGAILMAGRRAEIDALTGPQTDVVDLKGAAMFPGFVDSHAHLFGIGMRELTLNLEGVASIAELVEIVAANVVESNAGEVVYGRGWIETGWPEKRFPTRDDLDPISPDNAVLLVRADGHALVANSAALKAAEIDERTPDPTGGRIERDADRRPTGMLIDNAMALAEKLIAAPGPAQKEEAYRVGAEVYAAYGWTGLHNMSQDPSDVSMIERLGDEGGVPIRVYNAIEPKGLDALARSGPRANKNGKVVTRAVKLYADGALGSRGAALLAPYTDRPDTSGLTLMTSEEAATALKTARDAGIQVSVHAIGDRANRAVLDWYEASRAAAGPEWRSRPSPRWRIEHAQVINPADIPRFANLGVIASMQPSHAIGDLYFAPARLGPERLKGAYAWRSLLDSGAVIAGGSDAPVERGDPAIEFYAAVARKSLDGYSDDNWHAEEKVSRAEALTMFTAAPAYASFRETELGTIEKGKRADFSIFSKDLMTVPEVEILQAKAVMTVVDGEAVFSQTEEGSADH